MNMNYGMLQGIWTIIVMVVFVGIVIWAWSGKRKREFEDASNIPFNEEENDSR
jgi:cytochrome c oxidase cbb3-type subunit 4